MNKRHEPVKHNPLYSPGNTPCFEAWGIYADDTATEILMSSKVLAEQVRDEVKEKYGPESGKSWYVCKTVALAKDICCSFDEALGLLC